MMSEFPVSSCFLEVCAKLNKYQVKTLSWVSSSDVFYEMWHKRFV